MYNLSKPYYRMNVPALIIFCIFLISASGFLWIISDEYKKRVAMEGRLLEPSFTFNKSGPGAFKCYQDPDYGQYSSISECQAAALKQSRRAGIDQHCSAQTLCVDGAFCNGRGVCQAKKLVYEKCKPGECADGFYCSPQSGRCTPKKKVQGNAKCGPLFSCAQGTCINGKCVPDVAFQVHLELTPSQFILRVDNKDHSKWPSGPGLGVLGWNNDKTLLFKNWYNINVTDNKSETDRFMIDSKEWKRLGLKFIMIVVWNVLVPSRIDWRIRQLIETFGGRMIRYIDNNYVMFARVPDRTLIHEDVSKTLKYIRTEYMGYL